MKRIFDLLLVTILIPIVLFPIIGVALLVKKSSKGPVLYWSERVGKNNKNFLMPKFRSMHVGAPTMATHLLSNPSQYLTPLGGFLRETSLDELPQLWSIFKGDMTFVGPRPALYNQDDLIALRTEKGVHKLPPGITGLAQVKGRDNLCIPVKVDYDEEYLKRQSMCFDVYILGLTILNVLSRKGVWH